MKQELIDEVQSRINEREEDLKNKKKELEEITAETEKEEKAILTEREKAEKSIEDKLLKAYDRIRKNFRNGIAVAPVLRGACGGCYAKIPPQLQSDIRQSKKIVICENCGRINIDARMAGIEEEIEEEKPKKTRRRAVRKKELSTSFSFFCAIFLSTVIVCQSRIFDLNNNLLHCTAVTCIVCSLDIEQTSDQSRTYISTSREPCFCLSA